MKQMTLGQVVDFCTEYVNRKLEALEDAGLSGGKPRVKKRKATQADWDNFWG